MCEKICTDGSFTTESHRVACLATNGRKVSPVCSSLGMGGRAELIDRPDSESSRPETAGAGGGGMTADSWT